LAKHALPSEAPRPGKHAGYYDVALEMQYLIKALLEIVKRK